MELQTPHHANLVSLAVSVPFIAEFLYAMQFALIMALTGPDSAGFDLQPAFEICSWFRFDLAPSVELGFDLNLTCFHNTPNTGHIGHYVLNGN